MSSKPFDFDEMFRIQSESEAILKDVHPQRKTRHRIKSIHHLNDHGSELLDHPIEIIAESLLKVYEKVRDGYSSLMSKLFPRHNHIIRNTINSSAPST